MSDSPGLCKGIWESRKLKSKSLRLTWGAQTQKRFDTGSAPGSVPAAPFLPSEGLLAVSCITGTGAVSRGAAPSDYHPCVTALQLAVAASTAGLHPVTPSMRWVLPVPQPLRGAVGLFPRCCVGQKLLLQLSGALAKAHPAWRTSEDRGGTTFPCPARCLWEQDSQPCRLSSCLVQVNLFDIRCKCTEQLVWLALTPQPSDPLHRKPLWLGWKGLKAHEGKIHLCSESRHPLLSLQREYRGRGR